MSMQFKKRFTHRIIIGCSLFGLWHILAWQASAHIMAPESTLPLRHRVIDQESDFIVERPISIEKTAPEMRAESDSSDPSPALKFNQSGSFIKRVVSFGRSRNYWINLQKSQLPPYFLQQLESIKKHIIHTDTIGVDVLYSDYLKNGEISPQNSRILAVHIRRKNGEHRSFFAQQKNGTTRFYDHEGNAPNLAMDRLPLQRARITSPFSLQRRHPIHGQIQAHEGVDFKSEYGANIHSTGNGIVAFAGWQGNYGKLVVIKHDNGYETRYAHLSDIAVNMGDIIKRGAVIGKLGNTGSSTGPHLHYEVRINGVACDPMKVALPSADSLPHKDLATWQYYAGRYLSEIETLKKTHTVKK